MSFHIRLLDSFSNYPSLSNYAVLCIFTAAHVLVYTHCVQPLLHIKQVEETQQGFLGEFREVLIKACCPTSLGCSSLSSPAATVVAFRSLSSGGRGANAAAVVVVVKAQAAAGAGAAHPTPPSHPPMVNPACVVTTTMSEAENAVGGALRSNPGVLLPATDGSNCAETHVSRALIIYAVCCMLLSKVARSTASAYIFGIGHPMGPA